MKKSIKKSKEGFTLIEVMVTAVIIAILAAIAIPSYIGLKEQAQTNKDAYQTAISEDSTNFLAATGIDPN